MVIGDELGWGQDGVVYDTDAESVVKVIKYRQPYIRERDAYLRLQQHNVTVINGFAVPKLISYDNTLLVVEMGKVSPPCIVEFAGSVLDSPPEFDETMAT